MPCYFFSTCYNDQTLVLDIKICIQNRPSGPYSASRRRIDPAGATLAGHLLMERIVQLALQLRELSMRFVRLTHLPLRDLGVVLLGNVPDHKLPQLSVQVRRAEQELDCGGRVELCFDSGERQLAQVVDPVAVRGDV